MYTEAFKEAMVVKMALPGGFSATELSKETGVSQPTLSKWKKTYGSVGNMDVGKDRSKRRPKDWNGQERLQAITDTAKMSEEDLGAYLRREGLHFVQVEQWKVEIVKALSREPGKRRGISEEKKKIKELEREVRRKDKALAEVTALLILKKKADLIWGVAEDDEST